MRLRDRPGPGRARRHWRLPGAAAGPGRVARSRSGAGRNPAFRLHTAVYRLRGRLECGDSSAAGTGPARRGAVRVQPEADGDMTRQSKSEEIVRAENARLDFSRSMSYGDY